MNKKISWYKALNNWIETFFKQMVLVYNIYMLTNMLDMFNVYKRSLIVTAGGKIFCRFELFNKEKTYRFPSCSNIAGTLKVIVEVF